MGSQTLESEVRAEERLEMPRSALAEQVLRKPYAVPLVASYELDPHDVSSPDALTANG